MIKPFVSAILCICLCHSFQFCSNNKAEKLKEAKSPKRGTFAYDKTFLQHHDTSLVILSVGNSAIIVSPAFQAKVFTSTADGEEGKSFGWINYKAFDVRPDPHMNAFGGENRLWLGPEGGRYSLFFSKGDSMVFDHWKTPSPIDTEKWNIENKDEKQVTLSKQINIYNYAGTELDMLVTRTISIQDKSDIEKTLSITIGDSVNAVGYATNNILKNTGSNEWKEPAGMPCIWILDMFNPSATTTIVIPFKPASAGEKVATTDYFGKIPNERIKLDSSTLFFKADGKRRGKLGINPAHALNRAGSFDAKNNILTITWFDVDSTARYLNQEWNTSKPVFSGDAVNAYNDGPLTNGTQMGPFYEIESVSPAAALKPGQEILHNHNVYHFTGKRDQLDKIAQSVLHVSLNEIANALK